MTRLAMEEVKQDLITRKIQNMPAAHRGELMRIADVIVMFDGGSST